MTIRITILVDDTSGKNETLAEHGLSYWIETPHASLLFDTGQGFVIENNAKKLGINLSTTNGIALSHGHYDHSGGLPFILDKASQKTPIYMHPDAILTRYGIASPGKARSVGMSEKSKLALEKRSSDIIHTLSITEIGKNLYLTGEIPKNNAFENDGEKFFFDPEGRVRDLVRDDQAVFYTSEKGIVVICGCAHSGIINTVQHILSFCGTKKILAIIGGFHLIDNNLERTIKTIEEFKKLDLERIAPCHCTKMKHRSLIWSAFPNQCVDCTVGKVFEF